MFRTNLNLFANSQKSIKNPSLTVKATLSNGPNMVTFNLAWVMKEAVTEPMRTISASPTVQSGSFSQIKEASREVKRHLKLENGMLNSRLTTKIGVKWQCCAMMAVSMWDTRKLKMLYFSSLTKQRSSLSLIRRPSQSLKAKKTTLSGPLLTQCTKRTVKKEIGGIVLVPCFPMENASTCSSSID